MIKINLLPIKAAKKREYINQQLLLLGVVLVGTCVLLGMWFLHGESKIKGQRDQIATAKNQIVQYEKAIGEVSKYKGLEESLNRKLGVIEGLIKGKTGPVKVLDFLSQAIPREVWVLSWTESAGSVSIKGEALTNKDVAQFMALLGGVNASKAATPDGAAAPKDGKDGKDGKDSNEGKGELGGQTFFSDIRLVRTQARNYAEFSRAFVEFEIKMKVNYSI